MPFRDRLRTRLRRDALAVLVGGIVVLIGTSSAGAVIVRDRVAHEARDERLDRAVPGGRGEGEREIEDLSQLVHVRAGRAALSREGLLGAAAIAAIAVEAAQVGTEVERRATVGARRVHLRAVPISAGRSGGTTVAVGVVTDDTGPRRAFLGRLAVVQATLLVVLVAAAVAASRRSTRVLEALFAHEDRLVLAVAHELRGPLSRVLAQVDRGLRTATGPESVLPAIARDAEALAELIDDLLEVARVMAGAVPLPSDPVPVDHVVRRMAEGALGGEPPVLALTPVEVTGSARLLRVAIANLVGNAQRHGRGAAGQATVTVDGHGVTVTDRGPGVPGPRLAELRRALHLGLRRPRSTGLGLSLAAWVAEAHGGRLELANRPGGGFEARLRLPTRPRAEDP